MALDCRIVSDFAELVHISEQWESIASAKKLRGHGSVFQSWNWASACWAERDSDVRLYTPVVTESGRVVAIMPLVLSRHTLKWLGSPYADYNDIVCESSRHEALVVCWQTLLASSHWTTCVLENVPDWSAILSMSNQLPSSLRRRSISVPRFPYSSVRDDGSGIFERLSQKRSFRQRENQLRRAGRSLVFRHMEEPAESRSHLDEFFAMHISRSALGGRRSLFASRSAQALFRRLVDSMNPTSELRFAALELDGRALAYHLGFQENCKLISYVSAFDVDYWELSPGEVLLRNMFKYAHRSKLDEFDFTIGDEAYKSRFVNFTGNTYTLYFDRNLKSPKTHASRIIRCAEKYVRQKQATLALARQMVTAFRKLPGALRKLRRTLVGLTQSSIVSTEFQVGLSAERPASTKPRVQRMSLYSLGLYLHEKHTHIGASQLERFRNDFKRRAELYRVSTMSGEFLVWKSGDHIWEDALTFCSSTCDFGFAIAALLEHAQVSAVLLTTRRRRARHWLSNAGLWLEKPPSVAPDLDHMYSSASD